MFNECFVGYAMLLRLILTCIFRIIGNVLDDLATHVTALLRVIKDYNFIISFFAQEIQN